MPTETPPLTVAEAARTLGVSPATVRRLIAAGTLPAAHKLPGPNGAFLIARDAVDAHAAQRAAS